LDPYRVNDVETPKKKESFVDNLTEPQKRILGIVLSIVSGCFYGVNFNPPQYIIDHSLNKNGLDYVFSHFSGIFFTSTLLIIIYSAIKKNYPVVYPQAVLPGIVSGLLWSFAQIAWFVANGKLEMIITFPIISTGPGLIASLWGVLVFKEIQGKRNFITLGAAFVVIIVAVVLIALSKTN